MENSFLIADALRQTDLALHDRINGGNAWGTDLKLRGARVKKYRRYERGDHDADMTAEMRNALRLVQDEAGLNDMNANYCRIVIDKMAGRVRLQSAAAANDDGWVGATLARNNFDALQVGAWRGAIRDGASYVIVDPVTMRWTNEPAFDGFSGVVSIRNPLTGVIEWACKVWSEGAIEVTEGDSVQTYAAIRLAVYQPGVVTFFTGYDGGTTVTRDGEPRQYPPELAKSLPVFEFANQFDSFSQHGESELRPVIPLQNVLNRTVYSTVMASELAAFPVHISVGLEISPNSFRPGAIVNVVLKDGSGNAVTEPTPEQLQLLNAAKIEHLQPADIGQYIAVTERVVKEISQVSQTPIYGVTGDGALSGDALRQLEVGLIGKIQRFQVQNSDEIKRLIAYTAQAERVFFPSRNAPELAQDDVVLIWYPPELLNVDAKIQTLVNMREKMPGLFGDDFYRKQVGSLLGMSPGDIIAEGEKAQAQASSQFARITGADGGIPVL